MSGLTLEERRERQREYNRKWRAKQDPVEAAAKRRKWREANPERHKAYRDAWRTKNYAYTLVYNAKWKRERRRRLAVISPVKASETRIAALMKVDTYQVARAVLPTGLPDFVRDDIVSEIILAVLEGEISTSEIAANAKRFVTAYWRERDLHRTVSLNAPLPGRDGRTYLDMLAAREVEL